MAAVKRENLFNVKVEDLIPYENNPINHNANVDHIANSLKEFGYVKTSIVINEDNVLLAGHGTLMAIKKLGWETVPEVTKLIGLSKKNQKRLRIADNSTSHASMWDYLKLNLELKDIGLDMGSLGLNYSPEETDINKEYTGMPEFDQKDATSFRHIVVHFNSEADIQDFAKIIKQNLTTKTTSIWHPAQVKMNTEAKRY